MLDSLVQHFDKIMRGMGHPMAAVGVVGQCIFFSRFLVQWIASERKGVSTVPTVFWYLSLSGGIMLLIYSIWRADPVFIVGQAVGLFVYVRNIMLIRRQRRA